MTQAPPKGPPRNTSTLGIRFQRINLEGDKYSVYTAEPVFLTCRVEVNFVLPLVAPRRTWRVGACLGVSLLSVHSWPLDMQGWWSPRTGLV